MSGALVHAHEPWNKECDETCPGYRESPPYCRHLMTLEATPADEAAVITSAAVALLKGHAQFGVRLKADDRRTLAAQVVEAVRPALNAAAAEHCAQAILAHMDAHGPQEPRSAWRRHLSTAARVAAGAFMTREDMLAGAVEAIRRGDFIVCPSLQDHQEQP